MLLLPRLPTLKEWVYPGFTFMWIAAVVARRCCVWSHTSPGSTHSPGVDCSGQVLILAHLR